MTHKVEKKEFYHIHTPSPNFDSWKPSSIIKSGKQFNPYGKNLYESEESYNPETNPQNLVNTYLAQRDELLTFGLYFANKTLLTEEGRKYVQSNIDSRLGQCIIEAHNSFNQTVIKLREFVYEEIRKEEFPDNPSRVRCMYLLSPNSDAQLYWAKKLKANPLSGKKCFKVRATGKVFYTSDQHLQLNTQGIEWQQQMARYYWSGVQDENNIENECLFEGEIEIIEEIPLPKI